MAVSCTVEDMSAPQKSENASSREDIVFHALIDDGYSTSTKTYIDESLNVLWNSDDRVTIFNDVTVGAEFLFLGEDGDPGGDFKKVEVEGEDEGDVFHGGSDLGGAIFAVYPHSTDTKIKQDGSITYTFPAVQTYKKKSFGPGANAMVAKASTSDRTLRFKNAAGYLCFRLWGDDVHVSSVILTANGGEPIAGKGTITMPKGIPEVLMDASNSSSKIRLYCEDVLLGSSSEDYTEFWFALPPVEFTQEAGGFTITVTTTDGGVFTRSAPMDLSIKRKTVERMYPLKVVPQYTGGAISLDSVSSTRSGVEYEAEKNDGTFTLTMPTVTDFSNLVIDFDVADGDVLMAGGKEVVSGVTPVDASDPLSLVVCRGDIEKTFTLVARNTGLPVVRITTEGFTQADIEADSDHEAWFEGATIHIDNADGSLDLDDTPMSIKGRGNATWKYKKRPFALKFADKTKILGMKKDKRWVLLANWKDRTLMRNDAVFMLSKIAEMPYTVSGEFVELEFNGVHRGNYYLCEQIKISSNRVDITEMKEGYTDKTGGFLMEIDCYYDELRKFESSEFGLKYMFKDPDVDFDTDTVFNGAYAWMKNYINTFEKALKRTSSSIRTYADYLDMDSAIKFMLINEMANNSDFFNTDGRPGTTYYGPHSTYLYKDTDAKGGKLFMGPVWDFDYGVFVPASSSSGYQWKGFDNSNYYYYYLIKDPVFKARLKEIWNNNKAKYLKLTDHIDDVAEKIALSESFNIEMWGFTGTDQNQNGERDLSFQQAVERIKKGFTEKVAWMDTKINAL